MSYKVAILVGSLRKESWNRKLALILKKLAPASLEMEFVEIGNLPFYNEDLETPGNVPVEWTEFREKMKNLDGVLFVTAEYNRSVPAVLKNAIDVGSRPYGSSIWDGKAAAVISSSPGAIGGFGSNQHLRQSLVTLNVLTLQQPEAYISNVNKVFSDDGSIDANTKTFLQKFIDDYAKWVGKIANC